MLNLLDLVFRPRLGRLPKLHGDEHDVISTTCLIIKDYEITNESLLQNNQSY